MEQPVITPWRPWEAIPVALAALCASILVAVVLAAGGAGGGGTSILLSAVALSAAFFVFSVAWVSARHRQGIAALGLRSDRAARDLAVGAWFGVGLFGVVGFVILPLIVAVWSALTGSPPDPIDQPIVPGNPSTMQVVLGAFAVVVAAPLGEEVFFRGFLFGSLRGRLGFVKSGVISALVFAIFHGDPLLILAMFFVGLGLAWVYEKRGSLIAPIGAHAMFNVIGYTLLLMERS
ncbi:MAG: lysostaphin resistance A-like protein [Actinomycetota bacterium]